MKRLLFTFLLGIGICTFAKAQSVTISNQNTEALKSYDGLRGFFDYAISGTERVNINYSLAPKNPTSDIHFTVSTANPMHFKAIIKTETGKEVLKWTSDQISNAYLTTWDISKFTAGNYTLNLYAANDATIIQQINFTKK